jgi:hypothetical protein
MAAGLLEQIPRSIGTGIVLPTRARKFLFVRPQADSRVEWIGLRADACAARRLPCSLAVLVLAVSVKDCCCFVLVPRWLGAATPLGWMRCK